MDFFVQEMGRKLEKLLKERRKDKMFLWGKHGVHLFYTSTFDGHAHVVSLMPVGPKYLTDNLADFYETTKEELSTARKFLEPLSRYAIGAELTWAEIDSGFIERYLNTKPEAELSEYQKLFWAMLGINPLLLDVPRTKYQHLATMLTSPAEQENFKDFLVAELEKSLREEEGSLGYWTGFSVKDYELLCVPKDGRPEDLDDVLNIAFDAYESKESLEEHIIQWFTTMNGLA